MWVYPCLYPPTPVEKKQLVFSTYTGLAQVEVSRDGIVGQWTA